MISHFTSINYKDNLVGIIQRKCAKRICENVPKDLWKHLYLLPALLYLELTVFPTYFNRFYKVTSNMICEQTCYN